MRNFKSRPSLSATDKILDTIQLINSLFWDPIELMNEYFALLIFCLAIENHSVI